MIVLKNEKRCFVIDIGKDVPHPHRPLSYLETTTGDKFSWCGFLNYYDFSIIKVLEDT